MRLGLSLSSVQLVEDYAAGAQNILNRARVANEVELDSLTIGDRHATPIPYYQNVPIIARAMADWDPDRPIGCLFLLALWNPVHAAEQIATLSCLTNAPFIVQVGIGSDPGQFRAMGRDISTRGAATSEAVELVGKLLAGDTVSSERFGIEDAQIRPLPPRPVDWWIAGGVTATCAVWRLVVGPTLAGRIAALDVALISLMGAIAIHAAETDERAWLDLLVVIAIIGFTATVAVSRFVEHEAELS